MTFGGGWLGLEDTFYRNLLISNTAHIIFNADKRVVGTSPTEDDACRLAVNTIMWWFSSPEQTQPTDPNILKLKCDINFMKDYCETFLQPTIICKFQEAFDNWNKLAAKYDAKELCLTIEETLELSYDYNANLVSSRAKGIKAQLEIGLLVNEMLSNKLFYNNKI